MTNGITLDVIENVDSKQWRTAVARGGGDTGGAATPQGHFQKGGTFFIFLEMQ